MAIHDAYLRRTPFELTFPGPAAADDFVVAVAEEAAAGGVDPGDRQAFVVLRAVGSVLRRIQPDGAPPEAMYDYAMLLYQAFHFARAGSRTLLVGETTARALVDGSVGEAVVEAPAPAGYAQLPRNLFWIQPSPDAAAEAVDGFFWTLPGDGWLHVLLAVGLRDDRPGLAVVPVPEAPWADASSWLDAPIRPQGGDFTTTLPGGELEGLHSFVAAGEVLKLTARLFARVQANPDAVAEGTPAPAPEAGEGGREAAGPRPSALSYQRI